MKRLFTKYGVAVLSVAVAVAVLLSVLAYFSGTSGLSKAAGAIAAPFRRAGAAITDTVTGWRQYFTDFDQLQQENQALKQELAKLQDDVRRAELALDENQRLRDLLELRAQRHDLQLESARITGSDASNWSSVLTINKGSAHEVAAGDCVIDQNGALVGIVTEVGWNWSSVRTIVDSDASVGAMVFRSGQTALAQGDFSLMGRERLALTFLGTGPDVAVGDLVVTSGLGSFLPGQLVIGYVEELTQEDGGLSLQAVIRPETSLQELQQVFVVTDFTIEE